MKLLWQERNHSLDLDFPDFLIYTIDFFFVPFLSYAQEYGLEFKGQPISKDNRTELDLNPTGYFAFHDEIELSFSIQILGLETPTFGYVARIVDPEGNNIDIIYDSPQSHSLHVVYGKSLTTLSLPDNAPEIYEKWTDISLKLNVKNRSLEFSTPDTSLTQYDIDFTTRIKVFFGVNTFSPVQTTDVPRMKIKDVRISKKGKCQHHFPLNETAGNEAKDIVSNNIAIVQNPGWIKLKHQNWEKAFDTYLNGYSAIGYDQREEKLYLVGDEQMKVFLVYEDSIPTTIDYSTRFTDLIRGSRVFYDTISDRLICYNLKVMSVSYFNSTELRWERISDGPNRPERFWFHNKYYSAKDSTLYTFGGYGQHRYFNLVQRYRFINHQWDTIQTFGDDFYPRMHAAIGNYADTLFFLGGFGSKSGDQLLNPEHYTDLMAFSLKDRKFVKKYDFQSPIKDIDFAHSMVINSDDQSFFLLATTIFEYETYLQLLKGNLNDPKLFAVGDKIPYLFHNENSFCDLFYSESGKELFAAFYLTNVEDNLTKYSVYSISFPPYRSDADADSKKSPLRVVFGILLFLIGMTLIVILVKHLRKKQSQAGTSESDKEMELAKNEQNDQTQLQNGKVSKPANSILFFGGFQIINKHGDDITKKFSPLLKELFLLIFLYSIKDKGISVQSLTELLWFSMDSKSAKNNRAVNIAKLNNLLSEIENCELTRTTGYWQIKFNDSIVYNDYSYAFKMIHQEKTLSKEELMQFLCIIDKGPLLGNVSYEWLDEFKLDCSNKIIDSLIQYVDQDNIASEPELMIQLADAILIFDMVHEEAICIKCKALTTFGKHSLAKEVFAKFSKDYFTLYDEPFDKSFTDIIKH